MAQKEKPIEFVGSVEKVTTLADGGLRVAFDMPENAVVQAAQLMEMRRIGVTVRVTVVGERG